MRGEHACSAQPATSRFGSAPRARGTPGARQPPDRQWRISPACAGNTRASRILSRAATDQPRVRGEHRSGARARRAQHGSAPRARGTPCVHDSGEFMIRISPACAGNTSSTTSRSRWRTDQPRVRGEHRPGDVHVAPDAGSAPRARGTPRGSVAARGATRISPACAGNTAAACPCWPSVPDQPRVRGEHMRRIWRCDSVCGSAPRARGTQHIHETRQVRRRISPACAGNTPAGPNPPRNRPDQPRVRGEHVRRQRGGLGGGGSAPRARGTPLPRRGARRAVRISPACAGNTLPVPYCF